MSTILDSTGRPFDLQATLKAIREPQSAHVAHLAHEFDAHPARGLTPARLAAIMKAAEDGDLVPQIELADDMEERDAHLYAELGKRRGAITGVEWSVEAPDNPSAEEKSLTDQVRDWLDMITAHSNGVDGDMSAVISTMTDAILKGFAPQEMVWDYQADGTGRKVLVPRITAQPQRWFSTSADRRHFLLRSQAITPGQGLLPAKQGEPLQPLAWLMHVHPARNGYLARMSLARVLFWPYLFKNYSIRDLAEFLEIYGLPLRVGKYPTGASDGEKRKLLQAVTEIGHNAAGIIPMGMALEFQAAAAGTEVPFVAMWDRMDAAESKAILGQTLSASEGQHGTQALGKVHEGVRMDVRQSDCELIGDSVTRQLIRPMVLLNQAGANPRRLPRLRLDTGEPEDLEVYATNLPKLAKAGLKIGVKWAQDKLRIPEPAAGEEVMSGADPVDPAAVPGQPGQPGAKPPAKKADPAKPKASEAQREALAALITGLAAGVPLNTTPDDGPAPDLIDALVAEQAADWQPLLAPMIEPLLAELDKAVAAGETLQAFAARLPQLVRSIDAQPITEQLARAAFSARLAGEADLDLDNPAA